MEGAGSFSSLVRTLMKEEFLVEVWVDHQWKEFGWAWTLEDAAYLASSICQDDIFTRPSETFRDAKVQIVTPEGKIL